MNLPKDSPFKTLKYLGEGAQGRVYLIDNHRCIKVYKDNRFLPLELANLKQAEKKTKLFPKVYGWGNNFMIREYVKGIDLDEYLNRHPLSKSISYQLVGLIKTFKRIHFNRLDARLSNIVITPKGVLRPIDPASVMWYKQEYPKILLSQLKKLGLKKRFLKHVKEIDKNLYKDWKQKSQ